MRRPIRMPPTKAATAAAGAGLSSALARTRTAADLAASGLASRAFPTSAARFSLTWWRTPETLSLARALTSVFSASAATMSPTFWRGARSPRAAAPRPAGAAAAFASPLALACRPHRGLHPSHVLLHPVDRLQSEERAARWSDRGQPCVLPSGRAYPARRPRKPADR